MEPIEIRPNRFGYLIPLVLTLGLMAVFSYFILFNPDGESFETPLYVTTAFVLLVGTFFSVFLIRRFISNSFTFRIDNQGIESNEGGVSTGVIPWSEIREVREVQVPYRRTTQTVLAVFLHHPEAYRTQYNPALEALLNFAGELNGTSIMITPQVLGSQYNRVVQLMTSKVQVSVAPHLPFEEEKQEGALERPAPALPASNDPVVRFFKYLYEYRLGKQKADIRLYGFMAIALGFFALEIIFPDAPVRPMFIFIGLFALLFGYAIYKMRSRPRKDEDTLPL